MVLAHHWSSVFVRSSHFLALASHLSQPLEMLLAVTKDLQVISSPPVQSTTAVPNDPAIIQFHYPCLPSASSSFPPDSAVPATNISSNTRLGHPNSTFRGNLPLNQPVGSLGSWSSLPPPPTAYGNGFSMPTYWPRHSGTSGEVSHLQQQSLLRPPQGFPVSPLVQHQMQNPTTNTSLPGNASNFAEFSSPMLPTVGTGFPSLISNMPPPLALLSTVPTRQSATLPSKLSPNLMPNNASNALPTVTVGSNSTLASPLTTSSLDVNPVVPPVMDKPKPVFDPALPNQTISQSMPSVVGLSSPVHSESSIPSLLTAGQLLQPGSTGQSSPHLQTAHRDIEVDQTSTSESVSSDSKNANNPAESLNLHMLQRNFFAVYAIYAMLNGAALHSHDSNKRHVQGRGNTLNGAALRSHYNYRGHARGKANVPKTASVQTHHSYRGCGWRNGTENMEKVYNFEPPGILIE
ncbi:hypothetical protein HYC85_030004 [Camellia sinensis]|uniref:Uncharacterized protein n=1 Tax=Camellia sinensis TaxID=4442 RepID=A0A7J7FZH2_CAMSI|nr:hypothetical protein HYC85_030004 [Camellia sinensis]